MNRKRNFDQFMKLPLVVKAKSQGHYHLIPEAYCLGPIKSRQIFKHINHLSGRRCSYGRHLSIMWTRWWRFFIFQPRRSRSTVPSITQALLLRIWTHWCFLFISLRLRVYHPVPLPIYLMSRKSPPWEDIKRDLNYLFWSRDFSTRLVWGLCRLGQYTLWVIFGLGRSWFLNRAN